MKHELKKLEKSQIELTITVEPKEYEEDLKKAAQRISTRTNIKGFRPGKAPYEMVKEQIGEIKIMDEALQTIIEKSFYKTVGEEKIETIGMPQIAIEKMAPRNDLVFKATVALMPIVKLPDLNKIKLEKKDIKIEDKQIDEVLNNLGKMQAKEVIANRKATDKDKLVIDMDMFQDKVAVEGGQSKKHQIYLNEKHYIPGLEKELIGLGKDDKKEFTLKFPSEHYLKHLAGKDIDFKILVHDVYELQYPTVDDALAKVLGQPDLKTLKELLHKNLAREAGQKEEQRIEIEIFEKILKKAQINEVPEVVITAEKQKMLYELRHDLEQRGIEVDKYLKDLKKTEKEIFADFQEGALKRANSALISKQIAKDNSIAVSKEELDKEIELIKKTYPDNPQVEENIKRPEVLETIASTIQNKKVVAWLKEKILKKKASEAKSRTDEESSAGETKK